MKVWYWGVKSADAWLLETKKLDGERDNIKLTQVLKVLVPKRQIKDEKNSVFLFSSMVCLTAPGCFLESICFAISSWHIFSQQSGEQGLKME